jgi:hypothetical protein
MVRVVWLLGCLIGCGFNKAAIDDAGVDGLGGPAPDASLCFDGFTPICLAALPTAPRTYTDPSTLLDTSGAECAATTMATADVCVIAATTIEVRAGAVLRATGPRPLVLLATTAITITGALDVASHRTGTNGAAANASDCKMGTPPTTAGTPNIAGGGGYGGTFGTRGGNGGDSQDRGRGGGAPAVGDPPTKLRGGCAGSAGAMGTAAGQGSGGAGGGAVELNAPSITVAGLLNASGAGGVNGSGSDSGAGGGGAGGMIVFDTPTLVVTGAVFAQGGAGGGGAGGSGAGMPGLDPTTIGTAATPGDGFHGGGGTGGMGGVGAIGGEAGPGNLGNLIGGGGGGGGTGFTKGPATMTGTGTVVPAFR